MTSSTEPTSSGSSALVGSSNSMTRGSSAIERAMATRCCWPPESWPGVWPARSASPTRSSAARPERVGLGARLARHLAQRQRDVAERRHVRIEVEGLEHHADALARMVDVGRADRACRCRRPRRAGGRLLQPVEAAQQGRLARARRPDDEHQLALGHLEIDALQDMKGAEMLVDARARRRSASTQPHLQLVRRRVVARHARHAVARRDHHGRGRRPRGFVAEPLLGQLGDGAVLLHAVERVLHLVAQRHAVLAEAAPPSGRACP